MARISKLTMAGELASRNDVRIERTLFGLCEKGVYTPTGSALHAVLRDYTGESLNRWQRLLSATPAQMGELSTTLRLDCVPVGNIRVEACLSRDGQFAAVQLLRFGDYLYRPVDEPRFFTGEAAAVLARVLK